MKNFRIWIALLAVIVSGSVSFAQESEKVGSKTGRSKRQTTKPASFRKKKPTTAPARFRRTSIEEPSKVLSITTIVTQPGGSETVFVIITTSRAVEGLKVYVRSADPSDNSLPFIRHAKRVPVAALRKAGIRGMTGNYPRYLCRIPKRDFEKGEALLDVTFASTKQPRNEVSSVWYYHLKTNTSTKVVDIPSGPSSAPSTAGR